MILVQDFFGLLNIEAILRRFRPGHIDQPIDIGPNHGSLCRIRMHLLQPLQLSKGLFLDLFWHLGLLDLPPEVSEFLGPLILLTQFASDRPHLFPEEIFPLRSAHLIPGLGLNLCLHGEDLNLFPKNLIQRFQPLRWDRGSPGSPGPFPR